MSSAREYRRDLFTAAALKGLCAGVLAARVTPSPKDLAVAAVQIADFTLEALDGKKESAARGPGPLPR